MSNLNKWALLAWSLLMFGAGVGFGYWNWAPHQVVEAAAPAVVQPPTKNAPKGAVIAERKADPAAKPKQIVPKGSRVERVISADVIPEAQQITADGLVVPCPKVHIDATVIRDADGAGRVLISSPDGETHNATDTVINSISIPIVHPWAAGASYGTDRTYGGTVERDFGRTRIGADVLQLREGGVAARARVLFTFGG